MWYFAWILGLSLAALPLVGFPPALANVRGVPDETCQYVRQHAFQGLRISV